MFTPRKIIIHHSLTSDSATVSWQAIRRYHRETMLWNDIGYHFGIEEINDQHEIMVGRMMDIMGAHTFSQNGESLGICCIGNFDLAPPSEDKWDLCLKLTRTLMSIFSIQPGLVFGHREFNPKKTCPGLYWDMNKFRADL